MKKFILFLLCGVLLIGAARVISLRYQDCPEEFAGVQKWIEIGKEKAEEATDYLSAQLSEKKWDLERNYDIDTEKWFAEEGHIYSGSMETAVLSEGTVKHLSLQAAGCKVITAVTNEKDFYLSFDNMKKVQAYQKDESLFVKAVRDTSIDMDKEENRLTLYIPADILLESVVLELGAGSMQLENLKMQELDISVEAGKLVLDGMEADDVTVSLGVGSMDMNGVISGNLDAECTAGNLQMNVKGNVKDYNYDIQCMAGNILLNEEKYSGINEGVLIDHAAQRTMELNCTVGNITITFE